MFTLFPYCADEAVPVLAPHVRTGCEVNAKLLVGPQHTLGEVGKEGSSFSVGQHAFHKLCRRTRNRDSGPRAGKRSKPSSVSKALNQTSQPTASPWSG